MTPEQQTPEERFPDDAVLQRVAAARPPMRDEDLSPTSENAAAIADRVIRTRRPAVAARPGTRPRTRSRTRWSRRTQRRPAVLGALGVTAAAVCIALVIVAVHPGSSSTSGQAKADAINIRLMSAREPRSQALAMGRTPLGAVIAREHQAVMINIRTGDAAHNRKVIAQLTSNETVCDHAATAVERVRAKPAQRRLQHYWALGARLQATGDRQLISALRAYDDGDKAAGKPYLAAALASLDLGDRYTGWAENGLTGNPGPLPHGS